MLTTLWIAYTTDNEEQKEILKSILPDLETCFEGMNIRTHSYAPIKKNILDTHFFCPNSNFRRLEFQSIDHVFQQLLDKSLLVVSDEFTEEYFKIGYKSMRSCSTPLCNDETVI